MMHYWKFGVIITDMQLYATFEVSIRLVMVKIIAAVLLLIRRVLFVILLFLQYTSVRSYFES